MNKRIVIIFTGGTISMVSDKDTHIANFGQTPTDVFSQIKDVFHETDFEAIEFAMKPSPSITPLDMLAMAKMCEQHLNRFEIDGIVITHGTDTLEETAYFLDLYLNSDKPVVITGSMRNLSEMGYDGPSNLASSILVAMNDASKRRGVLVVTNDEINAASEVTKTHTVALDTFKSMEFGPLGIVDQHDVIYYRDFARLRAHLHPKHINDSGEIIKVSAGTNGRLIDALLDLGVSGLVLEALGRGNVPPMMVNAIERAISLNVPVVLTSRCPKGRVLNTYGYLGGGEHLRQLGVIFAGNLSSQKARIRLMLALGENTDLTYIKSAFK